MSNMLAQVILGPSVPDCVTYLVQSVHKGVDNTVNFYITNPRTFFTLALLIVLIIYYLRVVVGKPAFFCKDGRFRWFLLANCTQLHERFWPTIWCFGTHPQTLIANYLRGRIPNLPYKREYITCHDGGQISLDWYAPDKNDQTNSESDSPSTSHSANYNDKPIAIFFPGLTGDSQAEYVKSLVPIADELGYRAVVFNNRGRGNMRLLTPRLYCASNFDDMKYTFEYLRANNPNAKIVATGISLGGILLARYLIYSGHNSIVDASMLISVCWELLEGCANLEKPGLNYALNQHLTRSLCSVVENNKEIFQQIPVLNIDEILQSKCLREFDERFTIKMWGFKTVRDYYSEATHKGKLSCIKKPTLCINAADDMFAPIHTLPVDEVEESSHVAMVVTARGGHIGFMEGLIPRMPFYTERLLKQYLSSLKKLENIRRDLI